MSESANTYKRLGKNTVFVFIGNIGPRLVSFILMPFYTFWLTESDFGIQDIIITYSVLIVPYVTLGLYEAIFVFPKDKSREEQCKYFTSASICIILMLLIVGVVLYFIPKSTFALILPGKLVDLLPLLYFIVVVQSFQRFFQSFTRGIDKMAIYSLTGLVYAIVILSLSLSLVPKYGLDGYWISLLSAGIASVIYSFISFKGWTYLKFSGSLHSALKNMLKFSLPLAPHATMWWIINSINRPLLLDNVGLDGVGLYAIAGKFPSILSLLFTIFYSAFQISALEEYGKENFSKFYSNICSIVIIVQIIITVLFELFGEMIFSIFIDARYNSAVNYLPILCLGVGLSNLAGYIGIIFIVVKRTKTYLYSALFGAIVALVSNFLLIPPFGIMGACVAIILSQIAMGLYRYFRSVSLVHFDNIKGVLIQLFSYFVIVGLYYITSNYLLRNTIIILCLIIIVSYNKKIIEIIYSYIRVLLKKYYSKFTHR